MNGNSSGTLCNLSTLISVIGIVSLSITLRLIAPSLWKFGQDSPVPPMPLEPAENLLGCTPTNPIVYFDLGGTACVCPNNFDRKIYWEKLLSGFAFNFPHVIAPFHFYQVFKDWKLITIAVYFNEIIEELFLAVFARWGFIFDPPWDLESRYDSLIRDGFCCMTGLLLGIEFARVFRVEPQIEFPLIANMDLNNNRSWGRAILLAILHISVWQISLVYNVDRGRGSFNPSNILTVVGYSIAIYILYYIFKNSYAKCHLNHIRIWHLAWGLSIAILLLLTIYPFMDGVYLCIFGELLITIFVRSVGICIDLNVWGFRTWLGSSYSKDKDRDNAKEHRDISDSKVELAEHSIIDNSKEHKDIHNSKLELYDRIDSIQNIDGDASKHGSQSDLDPYIYNIPSVLDSLNMIKWHILIIILCFILIVIVVSTPLTYTGDVMYTRHWCGNPAVLDTKTGQRIVPNGCV